MIVNGIAVGVCFVSGSRHRIAVLAISRIMGIAAMNISDTAAR